MWSRLTRRTICNGAVLMFSVQFKTGCLVSLPLGILIVTALNLSFPYLFLSMVIRWIRAHLAPHLSSGCANRPAPAARGRGGGSTLLPPGLLLYSIVHSMNVGRASAWYQTPSSAFLWGRVISILQMRKMRVREFSQRARKLQSGDWMPRCLTPKAQTSITNSYNLPSGSRW